MQGKFEFYNLPIYYGGMDYEKIEKRIIKNYSKNEELLSIYNWGSPSVYGISDIDIMLVFCLDAKKPLPFPQRSFNFLGAKARYIIRHPFIFIDEHSLRNLKYVYPNNRLSLVHGSHIKSDDISKQEIFHSRIALLNDIIIRHYPNDFLHQSITKRINVRDTLLRLNSLKYSTRILETITGQKAAWHDMLSSVENLRKKWFEDKDFGLLESLNEDAVKIAMDITDAFANFSKKNGISRIKGVKGVYHGAKNRSIFVNGWDKNEALKKMSATIKSGKRFYSILPIDLLAQLIEYSGAKGRISSHIRKNLGANLEYTLKTKEAVRKRIEIFNNQAELAHRLRHSDFAAFFDFGYRNRSGINNKIINIADRVGVFKR